MSLRRGWATCGWRRVRVVPLSRRALVDVSGTEWVVLPVRVTPIVENQTARLEVLLVKMKG